MPQWIEADNMECETITVQISRAYPDGLELCTPQVAIQRLRQKPFPIVVQCRDFGRLDFPDNASQANTFDLGIYDAGISNRIASDMTFDCRGVLTARAAIRFLNVNRAASAIKVIEPHVVGGVLIGLLTMGFQLFSCVGCISALNVSVEIVGGKLQPGGFIQRHTIHPSFWPRMCLGSNLQDSWLRGPAVMPVTVTEVVPWCSDDHCREIADKVIRRYVSSFNIAETDAVALVIKESRAMLKEWG